MSFFSKLNPKGKGKSPARLQAEDAEPQGDEAAASAREDYGLFKFEDTPGKSYTIELAALTSLRDFLPAQLPAARIMSYGYNSRTAFSKAVTDINDEAAMLLDRLAGERLHEDEKTRQIIFVSHSLGGIVVKKALILANERPKYYDSLLKSVRGSVFFGVPHRGADLAYWATFAANILKVTQLGFGTNTNFVEPLRRNSVTFAEISQSFIDRGADLQIRTFYETEEMGNQLIMDKDSARLCLPNEIAVGIAGANHGTICKFTSARSQKYLPVIRALEAVVGSAVPDAIGEWRDTVERGQASQERVAL